MSKAKPRAAEIAGPVRSRPFRRFVLRGLGVVMPPLLTLVLFIWAWATVDSYILKPIEAGLSETLVFLSMRSGVRDGIPNDVDPNLVWVLDASNQRVPTDVVNGLGRGRGEHSGPSPFEGIACQFVCCRRSLVRARGGPEVDSAGDS